LVALGVAVDQCASAAILVKPSSPIRSLGDLKGKRIASQTGTITNSVFVNRLLPSVKLTAGDVQLVNLRFQDMVSTLAAGSVDAIAAVDPFLSSAEYNGVGRVVTDFCRGGPVPLILAASPNLAKNTDVVRGFIRTWQQAGILFQSAPDRVAQIYADSLKARGYDLPREVVVTIVRRLNAKPDTVLFSPRFISYVREEAKFMQQEGQLSRLPDFVAAFPKQPLY
jgi:sulfonate transport system substrate-binding protein